MLYVQQLKDRNMYISVYTLEKERYSSKNKRKEDRETHNIYTNNAAQREGKNNIFN